jgi:hypothetical protein
MAGTDETLGKHRRGLWLLLLLGAFLTVRGYHCLDGDQAYRLPVLLHSADPSLYSDDPFVRSFDAFNPHRGSFLVIGLAARPFGLAAGLGLLFVLTFLTTASGMERLARAVWPEFGSGVGVLAFALVLAALAGNIGTNHLFENILLDRQMAFALGWVALGIAVESPGWGALWAALPIGMAAVVHPTLGLQLGMLLGTGWLAWLVVPRTGRVTGVMAVGAVVGLVLAIAPGLALNLAHSGSMLDGLPEDAFRRLSLELQGPQHMLPHLWRWPQWLAWFCYPALAAVALATDASGREVDAAPTARKRLLVVLGLNLLGLGLAWYGVECLHHLRLTLFQPFRMATVARGLCLVVLAGHLMRLWNRGGTLDRTRVVLLVTGLAGDWMLVAVTAFEATMSLADLLAASTEPRRRAEPIVRGLAWGVLAVGLFYLARHDTESGHWPLLAVTAAGFVGFRWMKTRPVAWTRGRMVRVAALAWAVPLAALASETWREREPVRPAGWREALARRCRFGAAPIDDIERLAVWCRSHTPADARFIGPPGPKTFRLWSRRSLAFNRAASPYGARDLAGWADRFRDHVGFTGPLDDFVHAYLRDRHGLEGGYDRLTGDQLAALASRQVADHVVARSNLPDVGPLVKVHAEGAWGVYQQRGEVASRSDDTPRRWCFGVRATPDSTVTDRRRRGSREP